MLNCESATMVLMHEGRKIRELLDAAGKKQADLARACGVSSTAAARYLEAETLGAQAWERASRGLALLQIDPSLVRPTATVMFRVKAIEDLRGLLNQFNTKQLEALRQILDASPEAQRTLRVVIEDRLERPPSRH